MQAKLGRSFFACTRPFKRDGEGAQAQVARDLRQLTRALSFWRFGGYQCTVLSGGYVGHRA